MMNPAQFRQLRVLFEELLAAPVEERPLRLECLGRDDPEIAAELGRMLEAQRAGGSVLDGAPVEAVSPLPSIGLGAPFGAYRIEKELGRGGMGVVYLASRADGSFEKRVAIKVLRHDRVDEHFLRRFERERQILAQLNHPHIASILDAGTSPAGDPYFVMEYVDGVPLNSYCRDRALTVRQKLELFIQICDAVQHAHRNLTVHRDLKPSNILVTGAGAVKLLDFGIAKLMATGLTVDVDAPPTVAILTPEYTSPEQIHNEAVTTATDVFALGILLYEMLSGKHPFQTGGLLPHQVMRALVEDDPAPVSAAAGRHGRELRGELDAIVLTALRKQPSWRYPSVEQFSNDAGRYLRGQPVLAKGDRLLYRARKFARRQWLPLTATALLFVVLAAGIVATRRQARAAERALALAERERQIAQQNQRIAADERTVAEARTWEAELDRQKERERYRDVRALAASLLFELYDGIRDLAGSATARRLMVAKAQRQLELLSADSGNDPGLKRDLAAAYERMGELRVDPGPSGRSGDKAAANSAVDAYRHAAELRRAIAAESKTPEDRRDLALSLAKLADGEFVAGNTKQALDSYESAWSLAQTLIRAAPGNPAMRRMMGHIDERRCAVLAATGNMGGSAEACEEGISTLSPLAQAAPDDVELQRMIATTHASYANSLRLAGKGKDAANEGRIALDSLQHLQALAPNNVEYRRLSAAAGTILAITLASSGDEKGSLEAFRRSVKAMEVALEIDPSDLNSPLRLAVTLLAFSRRLNKSGDTPSAHQAAQEAQLLLERTATQPAAGPVEWNEYADALLKSEFPDLADPATALRLAQNAVSATNRKNAFFLDTLAWAFYRGGEPQKAAETEREALRLLPAGAKGGLHDELQRGLNTFLGSGNF